MSIALISLVLLLVLSLGVWGAWEFGRGLDQQRELTVRGARGFEGRGVPTVLDHWDARLRRTTFGRDIARRISASGVPIRPSTFLLVLGGGGAGVIAIFAQFLSWLLGLIVALGVGALLFGYMKRQEERRRLEFIAQLPELARLLSNATSAGLSIRTAITMAAEELEDPARTELTRTAEALRLGQPFDQAMNDLRDRLRSRELAVLVSTLIVSSRAGGSLITSLRNISATLDQRKETLREVRTILGQSITVGWVIVSMGIGTLFIAVLFLPSTFHKMTASVIGQALLVLAAILFTAAISMIRRLSRIDV